MNIFKKVFSAFLVVGVLLSPGIGLAATNFDDIEISGSITLGGEAKSSWGSVVSPMTDYSGYTAPTDAGSNLKLYDDGDLTLGGAVATDVAITWDGNAVDYHIAEDDSADRLVMGYGSTIGTTPMISLSNGRTVYLGDATDNDFSLATQNGQQAYHIGFDDTGGVEEDLFVIGRGAVAGTTDDLSIGKASGTVYVNALDAPGNVDLDIGSADVDDVTVITDGGTIIIDGTITLTDSEVISNATDDTVRVASNDASTILEVYTPNDTAGTAGLRLSADLGDAAGEIFEIESSASSLLFQNDTAAQGTPATIMTLASTGVVTTTNYINQSITDTNDAAVVDVARLTHDGGTPAAGIGAGMVFHVDDAGGVEEQGSIDVALTTVTNGAEDADFIFSQNLSGTVAETLRSVGDNSATTGNYLKIVQNTTETDAVLDGLVLANVTGTATTGAGMGISYAYEDAGGAEEQSSIDSVLTTATDSSEDADIVFNTQNSGTVGEVGRLVGDSSATTGSYLKITQQTSETDAVLDALVLTNVTGTAAAGAGIGISFQPEDAGGAEEQASIDVALTTATDSSEMADVIIKQNTAGAIAETLRMVAASSATAGDYLKITQNTTETDAVLDALVLANATGTATTGAGIGISFQPEDATGSEEQASIDTVFTDATRATADVDFVFNQNVNGTITERVRFDADGSNIVLSGATPAITIGDAGEEDTQITFDGNAVDFSFGLDDTADSVSLSLGTALGTTEVFNADGTTLTVTDDLKFNSTLFASGRFGASSTLASSSSQIFTGSMSYSVLTKSIGNEPEVSTLPNGTAGQVLVLQILHAGTSGTWTVTPTTSATVSTLVFNAAGDSVTLLYDATIGWFVLSPNSVTVTLKGTQA